MNQNMKNVGKKLNLPYDKILCRVHFILLFNIFYWLYCFCIVYIKIKYYLIPCISLIQIQGFPGEGGEFFKCHEIFTKIVMENLGMSGDFVFKSPEHPGLAIY